MECKTLIHFRLWKSVKIVLKWQFPLELSLFLRTFATEINNSVGDNKFNLIYYGVQGNFE